MMRQRVLICLTLAVAVALVTVPRGPMGVVDAQAVAGCGLEQPAFCETFDSAFDNRGGNARSGQLNGTLWGVSRALGAVNFGQGEYNAAPAVRLVGCPETAQVRPPDDVIVCNGQLREASNDNPSGGFEGGSVTALAIYPKQPFDWAGRTGKVTFDVANDTHGSHATWPELWITNLPVPVPFAHLESWQALPQYGFGLRFHGSIDKNGVPSPCPQGDGKPFVGLGSAIVVNNYVGHDTETGDHSVMIRGFDCVSKATQDGQLNHYEIDVSQDQIDVYATDAGSLAPLKHLGSITNVGLGFTRGLIWLEDVHYNADKGDSNNPPASQREHTFVWDNVGFDGPFTYRDLSFDALDDTQARGDGTVNLGKFAEANQATSWDVVGIPADASAEAVRPSGRLAVSRPARIHLANVRGDDLNRGPGCGHQRRDDRCGSTDRDEQRQHRAFECWRAAHGNADGHSSASDSHADRQRQPDGCRPARQSRPDGRADDTAHGRDVSMPSASHGICWEAALTSAPRSIAGRSLQVKSSPEGSPEGATVRPDGPRRQVRLQLASRGVRTELDW
jgi:hypothetical protein